MSDKIKDKVESIKTVAQLILGDDNGDLGEISSGLHTDFRNNTMTFNVRHQDGSKYRVTVTMEEI